MKNIFVLPTDKQSRIYFNRLENKFQLCIFPKYHTDIKSTHHIYITSDEEIKNVTLHKGKWHLEKDQILNKFPDYLTDLSECKLVIMTTDPDLIADGVQAIDDEFLEWFVKNPSCEFVEIISDWVFLGDDYRHGGQPILVYKIIIPKNEPDSIQQMEDRIRGINVDTGYRVKTLQQETLEEAAERAVNSGLFKDKTLFIVGAKWQEQNSDKKYSDEEALEILIKFWYWSTSSTRKEHLINWFKQFKKK